MDKFKIYFCCLSYIMLNYTIIHNYYMSCSLHIHVHLHVWSAEASYLLLKYGQLLSFRCCLSDNIIVYKATCTCTVHVAEKL